jgi:hypothetical protein
MTRCTYRVLYHFACQAGFRCGSRAAARRIEMRPSIRARSSCPGCGANIPDSGCGRFGTSVPAAGQNGLVNARSVQAAPRRATPRCLLGGQPVRRSQNSVPSTAQVGLVPRPREGALHNQDVSEVGSRKLLVYFASAAAVLREAASLIIGVSFPINR